MSTAYVGIGANIGDARTTVVRAVDALAASGDIQSLACSSWYRTAPLGFAGQADFVNGVARLETSLKPLELLDRLQAVERNFGRVRTGPRFGPRNIDLDLLLYDAVQMHTGRLELPHPRMHERRFVLEPLMEIAPALVVPGRGLAADLLAACAGQTVDRIQ